LSEAFDKIETVRWREFAAIWRALDQAAQISVLNFAREAERGGPPEEWRELLSGYRELGPTGREILVMLLRRLVAGRKFYADDFDRKRNWPKETGEELADAVIYLLCGQIKAAESYGEK